jgi:hypothetical protein
MASAVARPNDKAGRMSHYSSFCSPLSFLGHNKNIHAVVVTFAVTIQPISKFYTWHSTGKPLEHGH